MNLKSAILKVYNHAAQDDLYRNSIFLILSTAITSIAGFGFWTICTRLYSTHEVGIATSLVSAVTLISTISLLGYNSSIIRFMHYDKFPEKRISSSLTFIGLVSAVLSVIFVIAVPHLLPKLNVIYDYPVFLPFFVLTAAILSINTLIDSSFVAYQKASIVLIKNSVASFSKLVLPFVTITLGSIGIFSASTLSITIALILGFIFLIKKLHIIVKPRMDRKTISEMARFSFANYAAGLVESLSATLLPLLITSQLSPAQSGYFYIDMMIASAIYVVPIALSQVIFAQGSKDSSHLLNSLLRAFKFACLLLIPLIILIIIVGKYILAIFGSQYVSNGYTTLVLLVLAGVPVTIKLLANAILNIEHKIRYIIISNLVTTVVVLIISVLYVNKGIEAVGAAWLIGECCGAAVAGCYLRFKSSIIKQALGKQQA